jgi:uncharacterized protein (DUF169 family)
MLSPCHIRPAKTLGGISDETDLVDRRPLEADMNYADLGTKLENLLGLQRHAISITFLDALPAGVDRVESPGPASCAYWKRASEGDVFCTTAEDHLNCTIGAYTHGAQLPPEKEIELKSTLGQMIGLAYLRAEEVASIPHRKQPLHVTVYAPLAQTPFPPDVVLVRGNAKELMLITEAALAAGIGSQGGIMGRPTCAFIPAAIESGDIVPSFGCIGNRVYTGLGDDELYVAIPGSKVADLTFELEKIVAANSTLRSFHEGRYAGA